MTHCNDFYKLYCEGVDSGHTRGRYSPRAKSQLDREAKRTLFQVKKYQGATEGGEVYRAYVGPYRLDRKTRYDKNLYFSWNEAGFRLIGLSGMCPDCTSLGVLDGKLCQECGGDGWYWLGNKKVNLGRLVKVHKIQAPTRKKCLQEYEAE